MRALSVLQQAFALQGRYPASRGHVSRRGCLVWSTSLTPTGMSRSYEIEVIYDGRNQPRVRVLDELATRPGEVLPHTYAGGWLCLHENADWGSAMSIADTIVPWASEWLMYYEIWLATGDWYGGGVWPPPRRPEDEDAEAREAKKSRRAAAA